MEIQDVEKRLRDIDERMNFLAKENELMKQMMAYQGDDRVVPASEVYTNAVEMAKDHTAINSGITKLDEILGGFHQGQLVVISGSTGSGKTQVMQFLTWLIAKNGNECLWFNYELGDLEFFEKMPDGFQKFFMPKKMVHNKLRWLEERIIEGIAKYNTSVVFIDHMHFIIDFNDSAKMQNSSIYIGTVLRDLKRIAVERNIIIFLVSHMKKLESGKEPDINDMRDSSFIGQEADTVLMILRDEQKMEDNITHKTNQVALIVRKNRRTGKVGHINMWYDESTKQFDDDPAIASRRLPSLPQAVVSGDGDGDPYKLPF